jgi:hypothetical protein
MPSQEPPTDQQIQEVDPAPDDSDDNKGEGWERVRAGGVEDGREEGCGRHSRENEVTSQCVFCTCVDPRSGQEECVL